MPPGPAQSAIGTVNETVRVLAVGRYDILDTPPDGAFDRIARLAAKLMNTPMATVTIVDTDRIWFKAVQGLSGVTQTGRDPGLCASAILQDEPYLCTDALTDPRAAGNPLVHGPMGVRFYAAAPIVTADGHRLGTVNVLDTRPRQATAEDLAILQDLAAIVMDELELRLSAINTVRHEQSLRREVTDERNTIEAFATALQRSLLPPSLPRIPGLDVASHFHAASTRNVTGDFFDVLPVAEDQWAFFLGDVQGHGAEAAAATSLIRYTLRAAALHRLDPAAGLYELNAALLAERNIDRFCTVLSGLITPHPDGGFALTIAGGGHPAALWSRPDPQPGAPTGSRRVERVRPVKGTLVGAFHGATFTTCDLHLERDQSLLLFTDGLTESRPDGHLFGERRLREFLSTRPTSGAAALVSDLAALVAAFDPPPTDDVALLAFSPAG